MEDLVYCEEEPTGERWDPLGAPNENTKEIQSINYPERDRCECSYWYFTHLFYIIIRKKLPIVILVCYLPKN